VDARYFSHVNHALTQWSTVFLEYTLSFQFHFSCKILYVVRLWLVLCFDKSAKRY